jgi:phosphoribosylanthranilate isomerase
MGANAIGLVSAMPSGPGIIEDRLIEEIAAAVAGSVETFLLTSKCAPEAIAAQHDVVKTTAVQLCDRLPPADLQWLGRRLENVQEAIALVQPQGVDLCSGVRDQGGTLDESKLAAFMAAARARREER